MVVGGPCVQMVASYDGGWALCVQMVAPYGGGWALRAETGMTINLPGHPTSVTQHCLAINDTYFMPVVNSFTSFPSD